MIYAGFHVVTVKRFLIQVSNSLFFFKCSIFCLSLKILILFSLTIKSFQLTFDTLELKLFLTFLCFHCKAWWWWGDDLGLWLTLILGVFSFNLRDDGDVPQNGEDSRRLQTTEPVWSSDSAWVTAGTCDTLMTNTWPSLHYYSFMKHVHPPKHPRRLFTDDSKESFCSPCLQLRNNSS